MVRPKARTTAANANVIVSAGQQPVPGPGDYSPVDRRSEHLGLSAHSFRSRSPQRPVLPGEKSAMVDKAARDRQAIDAASPRLVPHGPRRAASPNASPHALRSASSTTYDDAAAAAAGSPSRHMRSPLGCSDSMRLGGSFSMERAVSPRGKRREDAGARRSSHAAQSVSSRLAERDKRHQVDEWGEASGDEADDEPAGADNDYNAQLVAKLEQLRAADDRRSEDQRDQRDQRAQVTRLNAEAVDAFTAGAYSIAEMQLSEVSTPDPPLTACRLHAMDGGSAAKGFH